MKAAVRPNHVWIWTIWIHPIWTRPWPITGWQPKFVTRRCVVSILTIIQILNQLQQPRIDLPEIVIKKIIEKEIKLVGVTNRTRSVAGIRAVAFDDNSLLQTPRIGRIHRIIADIRIQINPPALPDGVGLHEHAELCVVGAVFVIIHPGVFEPQLAGILE